MKVIRTSSGTGHFLQALTADEGTATGPARSWRGPLGLDELGPNGSSTRSPRAAAQPHVEGPAWGRDRLGSIGGKTGFWIACIPVLSALVYAVLSGTVAGSVSWIDLAEQGAGTGSWREFLGWMRSERMTSPVYGAWLAACPSAPAPASAPALFAWHSLLVAAGFLGVARFLSSTGAGVRPVVTGLAMLAGFPLLNQYTKLLSSAAGAFACTALMLALLSSPSPGGGWLAGAAARAGLVAAGACFHPSFLPSGLALLMTEIALGSRDGRRRTAAVALVLSGAALLAIFAMPRGFRGWKAELLRVAGEYASTVETGGLVPAVGTFGGKLATAVGGGLLPLVVLGWLLALARCRRAVAGPAACLVATTLAFPGLAVLGPDALVPVLAPVAAGGAAGLSTLRYPWSRLAMAMLLVAASFQHVSGTFGGAFRPTPVAPGASAIHTADHTLNWVSRELASRILLRGHEWALTLKPGQRVPRLGVHALEPSLALRGGPLYFSWRRLAPSPPAVNSWGYDWTELERFQRDLAEDPPMFLIFSDALLERARKDAEERPASAGRWCWEQIRDGYGLLEVHDGGELSVWLLAHRERWRAAGPAWPLGPVPGLELHHERSGEAEGAAKSP